MNENNFAEKPIISLPPTPANYSEKYKLIIARMEKFSKADFSQVTEYPSNMSENVVSEKIVESIKDNSKANSKEKEEIKK